MEAWPHHGYGSDEYAGVCTPLENQFWPESIATYTKCPNDFETSSICASELQYGLNSTKDGYYYDESIQFGIGSFDDFGQAFIAIFQTVTLDNW